MSFLKKVKKQPEQVSEIKAPAAQLLPPKPKFRHDESWTLDIPRGASAASLAEVLLKAPFALDDAEVTYVSTAYLFPGDDRLASICFRRRY